MTTERKNGESDILVRFRTPAGAGQASPRHRERGAIGLRTGAHGLGAAAGDAKSQESLCQG
eukprot:3214181-Pyramimonas_sp.AAC.1